MLYDCFYIDLLYSCNTPFPVIQYRKWAAIAALSTLTAQGTYEFNHSERLCEDQISVLTYSENGRMAIMMSA